MLRRSPRLRVALYVAVPALVVATIAVAIFRGDSESAPEAEPAAHVTVAKPAHLKAGKVTIESAGPPAELDETSRAAVVKAAQSYLDAAVHAPLQNGAVGDGYGALFEAPLRPAANGADRDALTDSAVGQVDSFTATAEPVVISGLADGDGTILYVAASFGTTVKAKTAAGPVTIERATELTLEPAATGWTVGAYRVKATRKSPAATTTTVADNTKQATP